MTEVKIDFSADSTINVELVRDDTVYQESRVCDHCTSPLEVGDPVAAYACDTKWGDYIKGKMPVMATQEGYCLTCYTDEIPLPRKATNEAFLLQKIESADGGYQYTGDRILRGSPESEGIVWEPTDVVDKFFPYDADDMSVEATPMSVYLQCFKAGIDLTGYVKDGELVIPEHAVHLARGIIKENITRHPNVTYSTDLL